MVATRAAIVGRDAELAAIDNFLARETDEANALLLEGEPGIGKTTLWLEGVAAAERRGYRVLRAQPAESEAMLSYTALADLVGVAYDEGRDELPEPQQRALEAALLRSGGSANERTIGSALVSLLAALAEREPLVVAIDDVQWLDRASARGLEFAARRLPGAVRLLLARRPSVEAPLGLGRDSVLRTEIGPLSLGALHHLLGTHLGSAPARPTLVRIAETSGGNPFFALEIGRSLGDMHDRGGPLPVPPSLHDLVAGRLNALSPTAREAALVASALSRPTVHAVGVPPDALDEAEAAGVLVVERDRIRFSHPLLASAVYGAASGSQRLELHRRLADLVDDPEERALHLALSVSSPDEDTASELEEAAAGAARKGAQDAAADLYRAAHRLTLDADAGARARRLLGEAAAGPLDYLLLALDEAGDDRQLRGRIHAKLGMYSDGDQRQAVQHSQAAAALLDEESDPGLLAYTLLAVLFFGAQTGRGIDNPLPRAGARAGGARGPRQREELARPDLARVHGRLRCRPRAASTRGRVVPRPRRRDLARREARAPRSRRAPGGQLRARPPADRPELHRAGARRIAGTPRDAALDASQT